MNSAVELIPIVLTGAVAVGLSYQACKPRPKVDGRHETGRSRDPGVELARRALRMPGSRWSVVEDDVPVFRGLPDADPERGEGKFVEDPEAALRSGAVVRVLGCPRLLDAEGERVTGLRETALELLVYLVVRRDGVPQEAILRDVYASASPQRASERFSTDLANLRGRLRDAVGAGRTTNPVQRSRGRYRLLPDVVSADWWEVLDDWRVVKAAQDERDLETALRRIIAAYADGVLADGAAYEWLADVQEQSRRLGLAVHVRLAELGAPRDQGETAALLDRACDLDPFDEELAQRAIMAHLSASDSGAAVARCTALREALAMLDERPEQATLDLVTHVA